MNQILIVADINPMYYGTLSFLMFSGMLLSIGFWALHNVKKAKKRQIGFTTAEHDSRSRTGD
jgi:hypothetical protein